MFNKFKQIFKKTKDSLANTINNIFARKKIDQDTLYRLEEAFLKADIGVKNTELLLKKIKSYALPNISSNIDEMELNDKEVDFLKIKEKLIEEIKILLAPCEATISIKENNLNIIILCGVNGNGKTTTIGKLAAYYKNMGKKVMLAACDTYRAAASEQLEEWARRSGVEFVSDAQGADPASVAFRATSQALKEDYDILLIDTAGRLHNRKNLMDELAKIIRIVKKHNIDSMHILLVIDGHTGQNAIRQVQEFKEIVDINGLVITKMDSTAKAGFVLNIASSFFLPIYFIGIGEAKGDLIKFVSSDFAEAILD